LVNQEQLNLPRSKKQNQCFIATSVYGENSYEVAELRQWRDNYLVKKIWGYRFVRLYYKIAPFVASWIAKNMLFKRVVKKTLDIFIRYLPKRSSL
jgi:hypothetical protein